MTKYIFGILAIITTIFASHFAWTTDHLFQKQLQDLMNKQTNEAVIVSISQPIYIISILTIITLSLSLIQLKKNKPLGIISIIGTLILISFLLKLILYN